MNFTKKDTFQYKKSHSTSFGVSKFNLNQTASYNKSFRFQINNNQNPFKYFKNHKKKFHIMDTNDNESNLKRSHDEVDIDECNINFNAKKFQADTDQPLTIGDLINDNGSANDESAAKTSIQRIFEIKKIKSVIFDMISAEGPSHSPTFKFNLNFKIKNEIFKFEGEGSSKKSAKSHASLKALYFLNTLNGFFTMTDSISIANIIKNETKTLFSQIENIDAYFIDSLNQFQKDFLHVAKF